MARRAARLELGGTTAVREQVRGYGWETAMETFFADVVCRPQAGWKSELHGGQHTYSCPGHWREHCDLQRDRRCSAQTSALSSIGATGRAIAYGAGSQYQSARPGDVAGVVADLRDDGIDQKSPTIVYRPILEKNAGGSNPIRTLVYIIRTPRAGSSGLPQEIQDAVPSINPNLPLADVKALQSVYERSFARTSLTLMLLAIAGSMALLLGVVGIYGVISYSVSQRTKEVGIRLALGAPLEGITGLFVRHGLRLSGIGAICGLASALALTRLMKSLLFEVSPADPLTYGVASAALILAAVLGSYLPARRATRVDPVEALRAE
jgi:hypothetical protein